MSAFVPQQLSDANVLHFPWLSSHHNAIVSGLLLEVLLHFPTRKITFLRSTAVMWLPLHWLSPLSPHLIYGIRRCHRGAAAARRLQQLQNFTNFWHTVATTRAMTTAIAAAVCSCHSRPQSKKGNAGEWREKRESLVLTMKFATMPKAC